MVDAIEDCQDTCEVGEKCYSKDSIVCLGTQTCCDPGKVICDSDQTCSTPCENMTVEQKYDAIMTILNQCNLTSSQFFHCMHCSGENLYWKCSSKESVPSDKEDFVEQAETMLTGCGLSLCNFLDPANYRMVCINHKSGGEMSYSNSGLPNEI